MLCSTPTPHKERVYILSLCAYLLYTFALAYLLFFAYALSIHVVVLVSLPMLFSLLVAFFWFIFSSLNFRVIVLLLCFSLLMV